MDRLVKHSINAQLHLLAVQGTWRQHCVNRKGAAGTISMYICIKRQGENTCNNSIIPFGGSCGHPLPYHINKGNTQMG